MASDSEAAFFLAKADAKVELFFESRKIIFTRFKKRCRRNVSASVFLAETEQEVGHLGGGGDYAVAEGAVATALDLTFVGRNAFYHVDPFADAGEDGELL